MIGGPVVGDVKIGMKRRTIFGRGIITLEQDDLFKKMSVSPHPLSDECIDLYVHRSLLRVISLKYEPVYEDGYIGLRDGWIVARDRERASVAKVLITGDTVTHGEG